MNIKLTGSFGIHLWGQSSIIDNIILHSCAKTSRAPTPIATKGCTPINEGSPKLLGYKSHASLHKVICDVSDVIRRSKLVCCSPSSCCRHRRQDAMPNLSAQFTSIRVLNIVWSGKDASTLYPFIAVRRDNDPSNSTHFFFRVIRSVANFTACDNLGALNKVGSPREKTKPALKSFDLITALLDTWNDISVVAQPQHVRCPQDDRIGP